MIHVHARYVPLAALLAAGVAYATACGTSGSSDTKEASLADAAALDGTLLSGEAGANPSDAGTGDTADGSFCRSASSLDIWDKDGNFDPAGYRDLATKLTTVDGLNYRFGYDSTHYHATPESFPTIYEPLDQPLPTGTTQVYELGTPQKDPGGYNTTGGQVLYAATSPSDPGIDALEFLAVGYATVRERPGLPWQLYGGGHPDPVVGTDAGFAANGGPIAQAVAMARGLNNDIWSMDAVIAFNSGLIATSGTYASGGTSNIYIKLPANKVPTGIALTGSSEFALVTVWDTQALKGQVAVIALAAPKSPGFWGDWNQSYPGLFNEGQFSFMKLLGFVDIPGMQAPIDVSAVTDVRWNMLGAGNAADIDLSDGGSRASFSDGGLSKRPAHAGFAIVLSRSEKKVAFLDLQPLFAYYAKMYFTTQDNFNATTTQGQDATQWPFSFDTAPEQVPTVTKVVDFAECPTAVRASDDVPVPGDPMPNDKARAFIATVDGVLHSYSVGGLADSTAADPSQIAEVTTTAVGLNPTYIVPMKNGHLTNYSVVSRGDRRIDMLSGDGSGTFTVTKTLRDSRLVDPVSAEDDLYFGNFVPILTVADFNGMQVLNYRYDKAELKFYGDAIYGLGEDGGADFECGGFYGTTGYAFAVSSTNVP